MKINKEKNYTVDRYEANGTDSSYGIIPGEDVIRILKGYIYDEMMEMWFSKHCNIGYDVREIE